MLRRSLMSYHVKTIHRGFLLVRKLTRLKVADRPVHQNDCAHPHTNLSSPVTALLCLLIFVNSFFSSVRQTDVSLQSGYFAWFRSRGDFRQGSAADFPIGPWWRVNRKRERPILNFSACSSTSCCHCIMCSGDDKCHQSMSSLRPLP